MVHRQILLRKKMVEFVVYIQLNGGEKFLTQPGASIFKRA